MPISASRPEVYPLFGYRCFHSKSSEFKLSVKSFFFTLFAFTRPQFKYITINCIFLLCSCANKFNFNCQQTIFISLSRSIGWWEGICTAIGYRDADLNRSCAGKRDQPGPHVANLLRASFFFFTRWLENVWPLPIAWENFLMNSRATSNFFKFFLA